ncbi:hypothetical protein TNCV_1517281 [Trichonephila clavipes]|nr:hypothetical protein TNCV_1517281 [Trichonephila clavipes]
MIDPSPFANPTPLAHADTSRDVLPSEGTSQYLPLKNICSHLWIYVVLPNSTNKFRGVTVGSMGTINQHRPGARKPCLEGENRGYSSLREDDELAEANDQTNVGDLDLNPLNFFFWSQLKMLVLK